MERVRLLQKEFQSFGDAKTTLYKNCHDRVYPFGSSVTVTASIHSEDIITSGNNSLKD